MKDRTFLSSCTSKDTEVIYKDITDTDTYCIRSSENTGITQEDQQPDSLMERMWTKLEDSVDFKSISNKMVRLNWCWNGMVPNTEQVRAHVRQLFTHAWSNRNSVCSGGIRVSVQELGKNLHVHVAFDIVDCNVLYDYEEDKLK